jgi:hypothetical protein
MVHLSGTPRARCGSEGRNPAFVIVTDSSSDAKQKYALCPNLTENDARHTQITQSYK